MLTIEAQVGIKVEGTEGVEETLVAADYSGNRKESSHRYGHKEYERELNRGTQTPQARLASMQRGNVSWTEELAAGSDDTPGTYDATLRGLGFSRGAAERFAVASVSGAFKPGDLVGNNADQASATKLAVVCYHDSSGGFLYLAALTGTLADADSLTNYNRTGSGDLSGASDPAGFFYRPVSETSGGGPASCTVERRLGGQRHTIVGARGTGGITFRQGEPVLLDAQFEGPPVFDGSKFGAARTGSFVSGVPIVGAQPRVVQGVDLRLESGATAWSPILTELALQFNNTLAPRETFTDAAIGGTGYMPTRITGRSFQARIDPEFALPGASVVDLIHLVNTGGELHFAMSFGAPDDAAGAIGAYCPTAQLLGDFEPGDRDGIVTSPLDLGFFGDVDDEFVLWNVFEPSA